MGLQFATDIRNGWLDSIETVVGPSPVMEIRTSAPPAGCANAATGTLLATLTLPANWMTDASGGVKSKLGTWSATTSVTGEPGHFRIYESTGISCKLQGTASEAGLGGDMLVDITPIVGGFLFTVTLFTLTAPGA